MTAMVETHALVLRKTAYAESSLIIAALTPQDGQVHFLLKGALRTGRRRFPDADLFRHVHVGYIPPRHSELCTVRTLECVTAHDSIAARKQHYSAAQWISRFLLANIRQGSPFPATFVATQTAFKRLAESDAAETPIAVVLGLCFTVLDESGLLPDYSTTPAIAEQLDHMLTFAKTVTQPIPTYTGVSWQELGCWMQRFLAQSDLHSPVGWERFAN